MISVFTKIHSQSQLMKLRNQLQKSSRSYQQIVNTQIDYLVFLLFVKDEFPIIFSKKLGLGNQLYQQLFRGVDKIYQLHKQLLQGFEKLLNERDKSFGLSQHMDKYIPYFKIYQKYFDTLAYRRELVAQLKQKNKLVNYGKAIRTHTQQLKGKYKDSFLSYISIVELIDCLSKPFQRYHQYQLLIDNYINFLNPLSQHYNNIKSTSSLLRNEINKTNSKLKNTNQEIVKVMDKKYGSLIKFQVIYYENMVVNWYHRSKLQSARLHIFDKILLLTSLDSSQKQLNRVMIGDHSYFHHFKVGRNFTTEVFIKGLNGHMTLFIQPQSFQDFMQLIQNLIGDADFRKSWEKDILKRQQNFQQNCIIFRPISLSKFKEKYRYGLTFQIEGVNKLQTSFFTVQQLINIAQLMIKSGHDVQTLQEATGVDLEGQVDQYYAQQLALGLFQYLSPLIPNVLSLQQNQQLMSLLNLNQYVSWYINKQKNQDKNYYNNLFSAQQDRLRLQYKCFETPCVVVDIWITYNQMKKIMVGKNQRVYQIVKNIMGSESFTYDFTLFIGQNTVRLLDDDEILYNALKQQGHTFAEDKNFVMKGLNLLMKKQQPKVFLKKYLYGQETKSDFYLNQPARLPFLTLDILQKVINNSYTINVFKFVQILSKIFSITTNQLTSVQQSVVDQIWLKIYSNQNAFNKQSFKSQIFQSFSTQSLKGPFQNFRSLLDEVGYYIWYSYSIIGKLNQRLINIYVRQDCVQARFWDNPDILIFRIAHKQLVYSVAPSFIKIRDVTQDYVIQVDDTYGLVLALQRNLNIYQLLS